MSVESYAHKAAKDVVTGWFRDAAKGNEGQYVTCLGATWQVNRTGPHYGIWQEYPILEDGTGAEFCWDEASWIDPRWQSHGPFHETPPSYDLLKSIGRAPRVILDIAICHKGLPIIGIEIVHKNSPSHTKMEFLNEIGLKYNLDNILILPADWVLSQVRCPDFAPTKFWRYTNGYFVRYLEPLGRHRRQAAA